MRDSRHLSTCGLPLRTSAQHNLRRSLLTGGEDECLASLQSYGIQGMSCLTATSDNNTFTGVECKFRPEQGPFFQVMPRLGQAILSEMPYSYLAEVEYVAALRSLHSRVGSGHLEGTTTSHVLVLEGDCHGRERLFTGVPRQIRCKPHLKRDFGEGSR